MTTAAPLEPTPETPRILDLLDGIDVAAALGPALAQFGEMTAIATRNIDTSALVRSMEPIAQAARDLRIPHDAITTALGTITDLLDDMPPIRPDTATLERFVESFTATLDASQLPAFDGTTFAADLSAALDRASANPPVAPPADNPLEQLAPAELADLEEQARALDQRLVHLSPTERRKVFMAFVAITLFVVPLTVGLKSDSAAEAMGLGATVLAGVTLLMAPITRLYDRATGYTEEDDTEGSRDNRDDDLQA